MRPAMLALHDACRQHATEENMRLERERYDLLQFVFRLNVLPPGSDFYPRSPSVEKRGGDTTPRESTPSETALGRMRELIG